MITIMRDLFVREKIFDPFIVSTDIVVHLSRLKDMSGINHQ